MRTSWLLSTAVAVLACPAFAADLTSPGPFSTPAVAPAFFRWTGCYVGGSIGGGFGQATMTDDNGFVAPPGSSASTSTSGVVGGGQAGCDYQFSNLVVGAEVQLLAADVEGSANLAVRGVPETINSKTDWLSSVTGRVGWGWDRWLLYAKAGAAWAHDNYSWNALPFADLTDSEGRFGWTVGAGVELAFWYNWSVRLEYDFYDFGTQTFTFADSVSTLGTPIDVKNTINAVTVGLNYRFGAGY